MKTIHDKYIVLQPYWTSLGLEGCLICILLLEIC